MGNRRRSRAAWGVFAGALAAFVVALPAPADRGDFDIFTSASTLHAGTGIGVGGDGSVVYYTSRFSIASNEEVISSEDLDSKPYLQTNPDLYTWEPATDTVAQFTATGDIETEAGDGVQVYTFNDKPSVESRTFRVFDPVVGHRVDTRVSAMAFRSNADQAIPGPIAGVGAVDPRVAALTGGTIYVWDSEQKQFHSVFEFLLDEQATALDDPSLAMTTRQVLERPKGDEIPTSIEITNVLVAFSGDANPAADNLDRNREIFLWSRRGFLNDDGFPGGIGNRNGGVIQVTHTTDVLDGDGEVVREVDCWSPAVNRRGEVAFLSNADITGGNSDGSVELFLWRRGRFRQLTDIDSGTIGAPRWSATGRILVFEAAADIVRENPDESSEIFTWDRRRFTQVTRGTTGGSHAPATDGMGRQIAFVTDANLSGISYSSGARELVVAGRRGSNLRQVTFTEDGFDSETPALTSWMGVNTLTWISASNFDGRNSNNQRRIYRSGVPAAR